MHRVERAQRHEPGAVERQRGGVRGRGGGRDGGAIVWAGMMRDEK